MGRIQNPSKSTRPSFFKILIDDFSEKLRIPPAFIKNFNGKSLSECNLRGPSGNYWIVKVVELENGLFFCTGWKDFVRDHRLKVGEFLIFKYKGGSDFSVIIYDRSACEKVTRLSCNNDDDNNNISSAFVKKETQSDQRTQEADHKVKSEKCERIRNNPRTDESASDQWRKGGPSHSFESNNICFSTRWRNSRKYHMIIPREIVEAKGLRSKRSLMLQDPSKKTWRVELEVRKDGRLDMAAGWKQFWRGNNMKEGDSFIFEFVKPTLLHVHIFSRGAGPVNLSRSRPTVLCPNSSNK